MATLEATPVAAGPRAATCNSTSSRQVRVTLDVTVSPDSPETELLHRAARAALIDTQGLLPGETVVSVLVTTYLPLDDSQAIYPGTEWCALAAIVTLTGPPGSATA